MGAAGSAHGGRAPSRSLGAEGGCALRTQEAAQGPGPRTPRQPKSFQLNKTDM